MIISFALSCSGTPATAPTATATAEQPHASADGQPPPVSTPVPTPDPVATPQLQPTSGATSPPQSTPAPASTPTPEPPPTIDAQVRAYVQERQAAAIEAGRIVQAVAECTDQTVQYWLGHVSEKGRVPVFPADVNECIKDKLEGYHQ